MSERFLQVSGRLSWGFLEGIGRWVKSVWTLSKGFLFLTSTTWSQVAACIPGSFFAHMFVGPCKVTYLIKYLFQTATSHWNNKDIHMSSSKILKTKKNVFFSGQTLLFSHRVQLPSRYFKIFIIKESSKKFWYCASCPRGQCFKIVNFCRTEAGLTSK